MRDMTADADGWLVMGGERAAIDNVPASAWCGPHVTRYYRDPRDPHFVGERSEYMADLRNVIEDRT